MKVFRYMRLILFTSSVMLFLSCTRSEVTPSEPELISLLSQIDIQGYVCDVWGYELDEKQYAIVTSRNSEMEDGNIAIIDVTDPLNPTVASTIPYACVDAKIWDHYLYVAQGSNSDFPERSKIFDIADPMNPTLVGDFPAVHNIFIDDSGYLYITGYYKNLNIEGSTNLNVSIYDLSMDATKPLKVWEAPPSSDGIDAPVHDISVIRNKLYTFSTSKAHVEIFDVTDRASPVFLGKFQFPPNTEVHSGWVTEDDQYLFVCLEEDATEEDVIILDISNPASPEKVGAIHDVNNTVHNIYFIGKYAFTSFYGAGLRIYDASDPESPLLIYEYDTSQSSESNSHIGAFGVYPFTTSGNIYVSDITNGLFVFENKLK